MKILHFPKKTLLFFFFLSLAAPSLLSVKKAAITPSQSAYMSSMLTTESVEKTALVIIDMQDHFIFRGGFLKNPGNAKKTEALLQSFFRPFRGFLDPLQSFL